MAVLPRQRLRSPIPRGHWKATTFIGAAPDEITSPMLLDGLITQEWLAAYIKQVSASTMKPGDLVALDNPPLIAISKPERLQRISEPR